jgi:hypothetical protein
MFSAWLIQNHLLVTVLNAGVVDTETTLATTCHGATTLKYISKPYMASDRPAHLLYVDNFDRSAQQTRIINDIIPRRL